MEEKKLTDEEIVKDIELSTGMPSYWKKIVIDLIHRLQAENEKLRNAKVVYETVDYCAEDLKKAQEEIERLTKANEKLYYNGLNENTARLGDMRTIERLEDKVAEQKAEIEWLTEEKRLTIKKVKSQPIAKLKKDEILWAYQMDCGMYEARADELQKQVDELTAKHRNLENNYEYTYDLYRQYEKQVDELKKENYELSKRLVDEFEKFKVVAYEKVHKKAVKDTAKEILQELWDETEPLNESHKWVRLRIQNIASRKGVEVK